jgi:hypothetical protein
MPDGLAMPVARLPSDTALRLAFLLHLYILTTPMSQQNWQEVQTGVYPRPSEDAAPALSSVWAPMILGVIAAAVIFELLCPALHRYTLPWSALLIFVMCSLAVAILVSGVAARMVFRMARRDLSDASSPIVWAACMGGLWVPAWVLCLREPSILTVFAACFCVASLSRSIKRYDLEIVEASREVGYRSPAMPFLVGDSMPLVRVILPSLSIAVLAEIAATAMMMNSNVIASIFAASCVAVLVWRLGTKASPIKMSQTRVSNSRAMVSVALAFVFTVVVLLPYLRSVRLSGGLEALLKRNSGLGRRADEVQEQATHSEGYSGIILLPPVEPHKKIVAPQHKDAATTGRVTQPLVIPFDGAYWYFKAPDKGPRPTARIVRESSTKAVVRSSDSYPLLMEAHQKLDTPIDLSCCNKVEVAVLNADRNPGAIALELWVMNRALPGRGSRYLGTVVIPSSESGRNLVGSPVEEKMEFLVPAAMAKEQFDEIRVVIRTAPARSRAGAQIAIRRFVLIP